MSYYRPTTDPGRMAPTDRSRVNACVIVALAATITLWVGLAFTLLLLI